MIGLARKDRLRPNPQG